MAFTSFRFIVFLVLAAAAYFLTPKRCRWVTLFVANYVFYFISGGRIFIYLLATTVTTYLATVKIGDMAAKNKIAFNEAKAELDKEGKKAWKAAFAKKKKRILIPTLLFNFGILAVLKYSGFVTENLNLLFAKIGIETELPVFRFLLPLGISFYTFQSMGYLIDVYREKQEPERNFCKLALFISFFPQIVQGPISRFGTLAEQLFRANEFSYTRIKFGVQLMLWGAFKKMVIADRAAVLVDNAFGFPETFGGTYVAAAALAYAIQIYGDFSGGIDIATGAAQIFGVTLDKNFERPYLATSIPDYWRRWHMTLGRFFTRYVYIPLGGNRRGKMRTLCNVMIVMLLSGLWHGAAWTFVLWGFLHGVGMIWDNLEHPHLPKKWMRQAATFAYVCMTFVFFRAESIAQGVDVLKSIVSLKWNGFVFQMASALDLTEFYMITKALSMKLPGLLSWFWLGIFVVLIAICFRVLSGKKVSGVVALQKQKGYGRLYPVLLAFLFTWSMISMTGVSEYLYFSF